jgi:uncharacterized membrane protein
MIPTAVAQRSFGIFFIFAGIMHFVIPKTYAAIVPDWLPKERRRDIVYASGVAEIAGGAGVLHPRTRRLASLWSVATLVAVFPANWHMYRHPDRYELPGGKLSLLMRLPVQLLFIAWALAAGRDSADD